MDTDEEQLSDEGIQVVTVRKGIISQPDEQTGLLLRKAISGHGKSPVYDTISDLESQEFSSKKVRSHIRAAAAHARQRGNLLIRRLSNPKSWDWESIWINGFRQPIGYIPAVILGLLLNLLDALSYGDTGTLITRFFTFH